jgi:hypothetical protein
MAGSASAAQTQPLLGGAEHEAFPQEKPSLWRRSRRKVKQFQLSRFSLYLTLVLVGVDVFCIFSDIFISLEECNGKELGSGWVIAREVLGNISNTITCLFVVELVLSIWAFGIG